MKPTLLLGGFVAIVLCVTNAFAADTQPGRIVVEVLSQDRVVSTLSFDGSEPIQFNLAKDGSINGEPKLATATLTYAGKTIVLTGDRIRMRNGADVIDTH